MAGEANPRPFQETVDTGSVEQGADFGVGVVGEPFQGYVVTWDASERGPLSSEEFTTVKKMLGGLGLRMTEVGVTIEGSANTEPEPEPVLLDWDHFRNWAAERGYSKIRFSLAGQTIGITSDENSYGSADPYRDIVRVGRNFDLRSVYARLARTQMSTRAWRKYGGGHPTRDTLRVLVEYVNEQVKPEELLNFDDAQEVPYPWLR